MHFNQGSDERKPDANPAIAAIERFVGLKKHVKDLQSIPENELDVVSNMVKMVQQIAKKFSGSGAYRLIINNGSDAGQSVFHLHMHLISGKKMTDF